MAREVSNSEDILDSRDIIARIEELQSDIETLCEEFDISDEDGNSPAKRDELQEELDDLRAELKILEDLQAEASGSPDWTYGETLIRESYFERYAQDLADDLGLVNREVAWPYTCIDWEQAARELRADYFSVEFDGVTYWIRG